MDKIELLSPAGDYERLKIAFLYGADACYIGGRDYSLRANANNFSIEEIETATKYAHKLNKKVYVTVNIIFHNEDIKGVKSYLKKLEQINVDAVIIADPFLIPIIKENFPKLKIFISTQNGVSNIESVKFFLEQGVDRIVLAREVCKKDIEYIIKETNANLEIFLHGAMCSNFSGRCVLSNYFTNRDSNRGGCAQICRFNFDLDKKRETNFSLSPKDLNLALKLKELIERGVKSLKIEGRMRSLYYIATVNSCYRKLIDAYYDNTFDKTLLQREIKILERVANRDTSEQFFNREATEKDQYYASRCEVSNQDFLGLVKDYDAKKKYILIEQRNYFKVGEKVNFFGPNNLDYDYQIKKIYDENFNEIECANHPKQLVYLKIDKNIEKDSMMRIQI